MDSKLETFRARYEECLKIFRSLAASGPTSAAAQRDLSVSLGRLGDVLAAGGDLAAARVRYEESLKIGQGLAAADPTSAAAQRDRAPGCRACGRRW